jgi:hypothetical protein
VSFRGHTMRIERRHVTWNVYGIVYEVHDEWVECLRECERAREESTGVSERERECVRVHACTGIQVDCVGAFWG